MATKPIIRRKRDNTRTGTKPLAFRPPAPLRKKLEEEAAHEGIAVSQVIERRLEWSFWQDKRDAEEAVADVWANLAIAPATLHDRKKLHAALDRYLDRVKSRHRRAETEREEAPARHAARLRHIEALAKRDAESD